MMKGSSGYSMTIHTGISFNAKQVALQLTRQLLSCFTNRGSDALLFGVGGELFLLSFSPFTDVTSVSCEINSNQSLN